MSGRRAKPRIILEIGLLGLVLVLLIAILPRERLALGRSSVEADLPIDQARAVEAPAQATPGDPPEVPTQTVDPWRLSLRAFPDTVGKTQYACPGCDGVFGSGDEMGAAGQPLEPLLAVVTAPGDPERVYWSGRLDRQQPGQLQVYTELRLSEPPPYEVRLVTEDPLGYVLCPNSPAGLVLEQDDFDAISGGLAGSGRHYAHDWFFWRCSVMR